MSNKTYVLFGITRNREPRLLCSMQAPSIDDAAKQVGGKAVDAHMVGGHSKLTLFVDVGLQASDFTPGLTTWETVSNAIIASTGRKSPALTADQLKARYDYPQYVLAQTAQIS